jgi:ligand-binding SRPBCC domain-containing protein
LLREFARPHRRDAGLVGHNGVIGVEFEARILIDAPRAVVFDYARDIDLHVRSQARARERAVGGVTNGLIGLGEQVTWKATHFGVPFTMTSRITEFDRPHRFVDEQIRGPFARFRHEHTFEEHDVRTLMIDRVTFVSPMGLIGRVVDRLALARYLRALIERRAAFIKHEAEGGPDHGD